MPASHHIKILKAGIQTTVQDAGRSGFRHLGICQSGALDLPSLMLANQLVGNDANCAGLEITIGPVQILFNVETYFAMAGADFNASLDGKRIAPAWRVHAKAGQVLSLFGAYQEMRSYIAFSGGIDVPLVLGARATDLQAKFGGYHGRALQEGDLIPIGKEQENNLPPLGILQRTWTPEIRVLLGPEFALFSDISQTDFFNRAWTMSAQSNRMGARLQGETLHLNSPLDLSSHAVIPGTVQVPSNGQPIVLLADAQTTGGYPKIANVIMADCWKLAQIRPGQSFYFMQTEQETAMAAQHKWHQELSRIDRQNWK
jgi:biotin-dependent carboxylase-like uncharacterized protein